jgi:hypothetical protein
VAVARPVQAAGRREDTRTWIASASASAARTGERDLEKYIGTELRHATRAKHVAMVRAVHGTPGAGRAAEASTRARARSEVALGREESRTKLHHWHEKHRQARTIGFRHEARMSRGHNQSRRRRSNARSKDKDRAGGSRCEDKASSRVEDKASMRGECRASHRAWAGRAAEARSRQEGGSTREYKTHPGEKRVTPCFSFGVGSSSSDRRGRLEVDTRTDEDGPSRGETSSKGGGKASRDDPCIAAGVRVG